MNSNAEHYLICMLTASAYQSVYSVCICQSDIINFHFISYFCLSLTDCEVIQHLTSSDRCSIDESLIFSLTKSKPIKVT